MRGARCIVLRRHLARPSAKASSFEQPRYCTRYSVARSVSNVRGRIKLPTRVVCTIPNGHTLSDREYERLGKDAQNQQPQGSTTMSHPPRHAPAARTGRVPHQTRPILEQPDPFTAGPRRGPWLPVKQTACEEGPFCRHPGAKHRDIAETSRVSCPRERPYIGQHGCGRPHCVTWFLQCPLVTPVGHVRAGR